MGTAGAHNAHSRLSEVQYGPYIGHLGYYRQVDQALDYVRARSLHGGRGAWLSRDPFHAAGRIDRAYTYAAARPTRGTDPSGTYYRDLFSYFVGGAVTEETAGWRAREGAAIWQQRLTIGILGLPVRMILPRLPTQVCICVNRPPFELFHPEGGRTKTVNIYDYRAGETDLAETVTMRYIEHRHPTPHTPCDGLITVWTRSARDTASYAEAYYPRASGNRRRWGPMFWWENHVQQGGAWIRQRAHGLFAHELGHGVFGLVHAPCGLMYGYLGIETPQRWTAECLSWRRGEGFLLEGGVRVPRERVCEASPQQFGVYCGPAGGGDVGRDRDTQRVPPFGIIRDGPCPGEDRPCCAPTLRTSCP